MGDPRGQIKAARREALKEEGKVPEKGKGKKPPEKKLALRSIVRMAGTDLDGNKTLAIALMKIRGVGYNFARAIALVSGIDYRKKLLDLSEEEIKKIEEIVENPTGYNIPTWMLNRRKDIVTGADVHVTGSELTITWRSDIDLLKKIRAYKGIRHELGQPVRGQRTRSSFRKGTKVGVVRKKMVPGKAPEKREEKKK